MHRIYFYRIGRVKLDTILTFPVGVVFMGHGFKTHIIPSNHDQ